MKLKMVDHLPLVIVICLRQLFEPKIRSPGSSLQVSNAFAAIGINCPRRLLHPPLPRLAQHCFYQARVIAIFLRQIKLVFRFIHGFSQLLFLPRNNWLEKSSGCHLLWIQLLTKKLLTVLRLLILLLRDFRFFTNRW